MVVDVLKQRKNKKDDNKSSLFSYGVSLRDACNNWWSTVNTL